MTLLCDAGKLPRTQSPAGVVGTVRRDRPRRAQKLARVGVHRTGVEWDMEGGSGWVAGRAASKLRSAGWGCAEAESNVGVSGQSEAVQRPSQRWGYLGRVRLGALLTLIQGENRKPAAHPKHAFI